MVWNIFIQRGYSIGYVAVQSYTYRWNNSNGILGFESGQHPCREIGRVQDIRLWNIQTHRRYGRRHDSHEGNSFLDGTRGYQLSEERLQLQNRHLEHGMCRFGNVGRHATLEWR